AEHAAEYVSRLHEQLGECDEHGRWKEGKFHHTLAAVSRPRQGMIGMVSTSSQREQIRKELQGAVDEPRKNVADLSTITRDRLDPVLSNPRRHYQVALWIIGTASVLGLLILAGLLRSFYDWILHPIEELEAGVQRVAQGDFDHRIAVNSG